MQLETLPVLSLAGDPARLRGRSRRRASGRFGFAMIRDHGIDPDLIARGWELTAQFFALPEAEKRAYHDPALAGARGYTPFGTEIAKGAAAHDLKEFWHVGRDLPPGHPLAGSMPANVWPVRPEGFRETFERLYAAFDQAGATVLSRIAVHLGLAPDWFEPAIAEGNSVLRLLHYPPVAGGRRRRDPGRRARGHQPDHPAAGGRGSRARTARPGSNGQERWLARGAARRARWWSTSATCCSG